MPIYNASLTHIDEQETKRYAGLRKTDFDNAMIKKACLEIQVLANVQGIWQEYEYCALQHIIRTGNANVTINGNSIIKHLAKAEKVIILAITLGKAVEDAITAHFKEGHYAHSLLLDAAATTAVEMAADELEKTLRQQFARQGYQTVTRFSPGYGDWDIHFQPQMLELAQADKIGLSLTESMMLEPRKSITAITGLIPNKTDQASLPVKHNCQNCTKTDCLARKE